MAAFTDRDQATFGLRVGRLSGEQSWFALSGPGC
jgi:hypothetical protein